VVFNKCWDAGLCLRRSCQQPHAWPWLQHLLQGWLLPSSKEHIALFLLFVDDFKILVDNCHSQ